MSAFGTIVNRPPRIISLSLVRVEVYTSNGSARWHLYRCQCRSSMPKFHRLSLISAAKMSFRARLPTTTTLTTQRPVRPFRASRLAIGQRGLATVAPVHDTLPNFRFGVYPIVGGDQAKPVHKIRLPKFESLEAERNHRKLHQAAALRWLGLNGYNNEGAGGHVTVRDPVDPNTFWFVVVD